MYCISVISAVPVCQATAPNLINLPEDQARRAVAAVRLILVSNHPGNNWDIEPSTGCRDSSFVRLGYCRDR